jgi:hypothetical protein
MATIVTRAGKGSPLTHTEVDANFTNLNTDKVESSALATVATTGAYSDLSGTPTIPTDFVSAASGGTFTGNVDFSAGIDVTGNVTVTGSVDGRDVGADGAKLDGIEAGADVTDTANVTAAGALMDSEITNLAQVKAFDGADYATAAQGALANSATQPGDNVSTLANDAGYTTNTGDITGVTAGTNLSGGGTSGSVTLNVSSSPTFSGVVMAESLQEDYDALSGTSPAPDADNAGYFSLSTSGNTTFTFGGVTSGRSVSFVLEVTAGGTHTLTWPGTVDWAGGTAPDAPASGEKNVYAFITRDGGTNWYGFLSGAAMA